jgi:3-phenylpropionate/trans-cinnamate dioxygenase ferredoxin reductase subunit
MAGQQASSSVVVGAGQAGAELAIALRREGFGGRVVVIGAEPHPPYQRPPLSKAFLATEQDQDALWLRAPASYGKAGIEVRLGKRVVNADRSRRMAVMDDGVRPAYGKLAFATRPGSPRRQRAESPRSTRRCRGSGPISS